MGLLDKIGVSLGLTEPPRATSPREVDKEGLMGLTRKRQRLLDGFLISEGMLTPRACTVRDMTALGATVDIWDAGLKASLLHGSITLYIPGERREVECTVISRQAGSLGLKFMGRFRERTRKYPGT
jgi:hypothetical protein